MATTTRENRDWLTERVTEHVEQHVALYPQDASGQPGQCVTGEYIVIGRKVRYEIHMDTGEAVITTVEPWERPKGETLNAVADPIAGGGGSVNLLTSVATNEWKKQRK